MRFTINRATWRNGRYRSDSPTAGLTRLLNEQGFKCCLGFLGEACGAASADLLDKAIPKRAPTVDWPEALREWDGVTGMEPTAITNRLIKLNDRPGITDEEREARLVAVFGEIDIEVEFVGEYKEPAYERF